MRNLGYLLKAGIHLFINESNFKKFLLIIRSAGFISPKLIRSQNALNFAYILFLKLREMDVNSVQIESYVRRWFVFSILTGRYSSGSPESNFDYDIKQISNGNFDSYLKEKEANELSDAYWNGSLIRSLNSSVASSPYFLVFLASQIKTQDKGFLSSDMPVSDLISIKGDIHHIFPKDYLVKNGFDKTAYNQIANYVYMQTETNIKVGNKSPKEYFRIILDQNDGNTNLSSITGMSNVEENLNMNCVPLDIMNMDVSHYEDFLNERRKLISQKIKNYYIGL